ncbi:sensor histidine kinase [Halovenus sp. HT40]|uniref:sensor histidine kinase n=1 Tax=Halovenus sp. HT40 TaxID=3126691 RepID=UPI00300EAA40
MGRAESLVDNVLVVLGAGLTVLTMLAVGLAGPTELTVWVQATLPIGIALWMLVYGASTHDEMGDLSSRTILSWFGIGVLVFFGVGFWFGQVSRHFETSFGLAVFASLVTGGALGALIGVYAARLRRANAELERRSERLSEFASIVSHDLRNPITVASGQVELLETDNERTERIQQSLDRMERIIDGILTLTREEGDPDIVDGVDLETVAQEAWGTVETDGATLDIEATRTLAADPDLLAEMLENLFRNSMEHGMPEEGGEHAPDGSEVPLLTVRVGSREEGFFVADDGQGISSEDTEQIFETGYSTGGSSGLGLMIVSRIAETHGWTVSVGESRDGGAEFRFTID